MAENFVTIRKGIRFLRKMLFYDVKSKPVHIYIYIFHIRWTNVLREQNFLKKKNSCPL